MGRYANVSTVRTCGGGGSVRVTLSSGTGQGNGGTSLPTRGCYVQPLQGNTAVVRVNLGAAASATVGIDLGFPQTGNGTTGACLPLWLPVDDVAELYFYSSDGDAVVDILYFTGG